MRAPVMMAALALSGCVWQASGGDSGAGSSSAGLDWTVECVQADGGPLFAMHDFGDGGAPPCVIATVNNLQSPDFAGHPRTDIQASIEWDGALALVPCFSNDPTYSGTSVTFAVCE